VDALTLVNCAAMQQDGIRASKIGGVVIGGDYQGLGIARSLGRHGIPVAVLDDELSIARFSRYVTHAMRVRDLRTEEAVIDALLAMHERFGLQDWILFPTRDETVACLSRNRELLSRHFAVPTPSWDCIRFAWDKRNLYSLAEQLAIPIPKTVWPAADESLDDFADWLPLALKPAIKEHFFYETKAKAWRADTPAELRALSARAHKIVPSGELMLQELIPGDGRQQFGFCALVDDGHAIVTMTVARLRQHPPVFGRASTYVVTRDRIPELEEFAQRLLEKISYNGLVELEFKRDPRDGQYKLLDFNARTWGYHSIGERAGVDFPYLLFLNETGTTFEAPHAREGVAWIRITTDVPTAFAELFRGRMKMGKYARSLLGANVEAVFARDDILPGLVEVMLIPYLAVKRGF
jgi:D-aspartate ligase